MTTSITFCFIDLDEIFGVYLKYHYVFLGSYNVTVYYLIHAHFSGSIESLCFKVR